MKRIFLNEKTARAEVTEIERLSKIANPTREQAEELQRLRLERQEFDARLHSGRPNYEAIENKPVRELLQYFWRTDRGKGNLAGTDGGTVSAVVHELEHPGLVGERVHIQKMLDVKSKLERMLSEGRVSKPHDRQMAHDALDRIQDVIDGRYAR